jgi:putative DNA primase/helicase
MGNDSLLAVTLWIVLTYLCDVAEFLPLLALLSPTKRCGKTRTLGVLFRLVYKPMPSVLISAAALFRSIEKWHPTMLLDEADNFLKDDPELRAIINSGHSRDTAWVPRCVGDNHEVQYFSTWSPKAIAQIGRPHDTNEDRAIVIMLARRTKIEQIKPLRATPKEEFETLRRKIVRWVSENAGKVAIAKPAIPAALNDRSAENWLPLLAIAEVAGAEWPDMALKAIATLNPSEDDDDSVITTLLITLRALFKKRKLTGDDDLFPTLELVDALNGDKESPWADWREGKGISPEKLRSLLKRFQVKPDRNRSAPGEPRGYKFGDLRPVFERYLSPDVNADQT